MAKYYVFASEQVYYMKKVEADSVDQVNQMIFDGRVSFDYGDITDGSNFTIDEIEEEKRYG